MIIIFGLSTLLLLDYIPAFHPYLRYISPAFILFSGLMFAFCCGTVYPSFNTKVSKKLLQYSIIGLGFGMNLETALSSGATGMSITLLSVVLCLALGMLLGRKIFRIKQKTAYLISSGTAICGGSAIAAVAPIIQADEDELSVSLAIVFVLNAIALFIFPSLGHYFHLSQEEFGTWIAIAIHDTSSVVGAGASYGLQALETATLIKLTRALWIIPLALASAFIFRSKKKKISLPYFIFFFVLAMLINSYLLKDFPAIGEAISRLARKSLSLTMFFIGASLSLSSLKKIGYKALLFGLSLWIIISSFSLGTILFFKS